MAVSDTYGTRFLCMRDEEVVDLAKHGESAATEFLLSRYRSLVESKAKAYFLVGADRDDVIQEGMIGLCKAIRDFRGDQHKFRAFAELCVTRQIITAVKTASRHKHAPLNASLSLNQCYCDDATDQSLMDVIPDRALVDPEESVLGAESDQPNLEHLVHDQLSELERGVLHCYLDGKSYQEMSDELKCRTKAVDNALQRVKKKIGQLLVV